MGLLVFVTVFRLAVPDHAPQFEFHLDERPPPPSLELPLELRDNTLDGEWSRQEDFDVVAVRGRFEIALNHHAVARNLDEAQVVARYTIEY